MLGKLLRDVMKPICDRRNFRVFGPGRNRFESARRHYRGEPEDVDGRNAAGRRKSFADGRVMEVLSEHMCQGWLEGYLLTGRHGFFSCYEAFIHIVDSMFNQHAKWLKTTREHSVAQADRIAQLSAQSHVWRQDHNGFSPSGPGIHRSRAEQEGRHRAHLSAAGCQHAAFGRRPLPAQPELRQPDRGRETAAAALARHGRGRRSIARPGAGIWDWASNDETAIPTW